MWFFTQNWPRAVFHSSHRVNINKHLQSCGNGRVVRSSGIPSHLWVRKKPLEPKLAPSPGLSAWKTLRAGVWGGQSWPLPVRSLVSSGGNI